MSPIRMRAIVPVGPAIDLRVAETELKEAVTTAAKFARGQFRRTTTTWKKRPQFKLKRGYWLAKQAIAADTWTLSDLYKWISEGTKPRIIRPRRSRMLRFRTGYRPKTRRRVLGSRKGGRHGPVAWAKKVRHPGIKAREFPDEVADRMHPYLRRQVVMAMYKVALRSRWGGSRLV